MPQLIKIGQHTYPKSLVNLVADEPLYEQALLPFMKSSKIGENAEFCRAVLEGVDPQKIYEVHFGDVDDPFAGVAVGAEDEEEDDNGGLKAAKRPVNVSSGIYQEARNLAKVGDWSLSAWSSVFDKGVNELNALFAGENLYLFFESDIFLKYHESIGGQKTDTALDPDPADVDAATAKILGTPVTAKLRSAFHSYEEDGYSSKTLSLMGDYLKEQDIMQDPIQVLEAFVKADAIIPHPLYDYEMAAINFTGSAGNAKVMKAFMDAHRKHKQHGDRMWHIAEKLIAKVKIGHRYSPQSFVDVMERSGLIPKGAPVYAPGTESPPPPAPEDRTPPNDLAPPDDDLPPPPPEHVAPPPPEDKGPGGIPMVDGVPVPPPPIDTPNPVASAVKPNPEQMKKLFSTAVKGIAALIADGKTEQAKKQAKVVSQKLTKLTDGKEERFSPKALMTAALRLQKDSGGVCAQGPDTPLQPQLTANLVKRAKWDSFQQIYKTNPADDADYQEIALNIVKTGADGTAALGGAKKMINAAKKRGDKKMAFSKPTHLVNAVEQLLIFKANDIKLTKPLKPTAQEVPAEEE